MFWEIAISLRVGDLFYPFWFVDVVEEASFMVLYLHQRIQSLGSRRVVKWAKWSGFVPITVISIPRSVRFFVVSGTWHKMEEDVVVYHAGEFLVARSLPECGFTFMLCKLAEDIHLSELSNRYFVD